MRKKCAIVHYRIGKTDGVSLEIIKRKEILQKLGFDVKLISGPKQSQSDYVIPELEFDTPEAVKIKNNAFISLKGYKKDEFLMRDIFNLSDKIEEKIYKIHKKEKFEYLFLHNIFTHARHIACARAFLNFVVKSNVKTISVNHDLYWVGSYKDVYKPTSKRILDYLKTYVPPSNPSITHVTINSINQKALLKRIEANSLIIPDTFNFEQKKWKVDSYNQDFLEKFKIRKNDLVVLQATRISPRKGIELAVDLVKQLDEKKAQLNGQILYNKKHINKDSNIILLLAGYAEHDAAVYKKLIQNKIQENKIKAKFIHQHIAAERKKTDNKKQYSLWDAYVFADIITFPSIWEGWGNQFIEAVFARKPIVLFEYPVFKKDIAHEGYEVISLGDKYYKKPNGLIYIKDDKMTEAVNKTISTLTSNKTGIMTKNNFEIARKHHSYQVLENLTKKLVSIVDNNQTVHTTQLM